MKRGFKVILVSLFIWLVLAYVYPNVFAVPLSSWNSREVWKKNEKEINIYPFKFTYTDWYGSEGYMLQYRIDQDSLKIHYDCDFENCNDTIIYKSGLNRYKTNQFYTVLRSLRIDTLKNLYVGEGIGHSRVEVELEGNNLVSKRIILMDTLLPKIKTITFEIDNLLPSNKYRIQKR